MPERVVGPYEKLPAACLPYDPRAAEVARRMALLIADRLPGVTVEHIGSSAVAGCAGKGIVDLMLLYPEGQLQAARDTLAALGFGPQTTRNPFPEERPMRVGSLEHGGTAFRLHVHVLATGAPEAVALRAFRDRLRADPALAAAYVARKRAILAAGITDAVEYSERKSEFFQTNPG